MTNKYIYFIANWKMFGNLKSINSLDKVIKFSKSKEIKKGRLIYCPPFTLINPLFKKFKNYLIDIGAQNCHESDNYGSHTGFVNARMLKNIGANYVIIGHSENRRKGETDKLINLKGMTQGMLVILGQKNIRKLNEFADLSSDELIGGFDEIKGQKIRIEGYLEEFSLSRKEADQLIMNAREIVYK